MQTAITPSLLVANPRSGNFFDRRTSLPWRRFNQNSCGVDRDARIFDTDYRNHEGQRIDSVRVVRQQLALRTSANRGLATSPSGRENGICVGTRCSLSAEYGFPLEGKVSLFCQAKDLLTLGEGELKRSISANTARMPSGIYLSIAII